MTEVKTETARVVPTSDGFFEVWRGDDRISGEWPFISRQMAEGWIKQNCPETDAPKL